MPKMTQYEPITATCAECGKEFVISPMEQRRFKELNFELPKRCQACRQKRKVARKRREEIIQERIAQAQAAQKRDEDERNLTSLLSVVSYKQLPLEDLVIENPSKTLFIIGNGFDIVHGVKSSYWDFQKTLGKKSELRFHMETYLKVEPESLWCNLEDSLSHINAGVMLDVMDMWLDVFDAYRSDSMADFHCAIDTAMLPIQVITDQLPKRFQKWVESLTADGNKPLEKLVLKDVKYLSFNYTDFLELLYGVPAGQIKYIHGCRKKVKYQPKDKLVLGHVPNVDYLKDYRPHKAMMPSKRNGYKRALWEHAIDIGTAQWVTYYEEVFTKHTPEIIKENEAFFNQAAATEAIIVFGHSLSEVDYPYFKEILKKNSGKAKWYIGYYNADDLKRLLRFVDQMKLDQDKVFIFRQVVKGTPT